MINRTILFIWLLLVGCENNFLKNTHWRVLKMEVDSIHHLTREDSLVLVSYDPSKETLYQSFTDNTVEFRDSKGTEIFHYKLKGDLLLVYQNGNDTNHNVIVKKTDDNLVLESWDGRIVTLQKIK